MPREGASWDEDAWARWALAEMAADTAAGRIPPQDDGRDAWISLAGERDPEEPDLAGLAQGGSLDAMPPDAELAALAFRACDPGVLGSLSDNEVLGLAAAGRRLAARAAWIQQAAVAEFAARRLEPDAKKATPLGFTEFAPDELAPELMATFTAAELTMARAREVSRRLPACFARLRDGKISEYQLLIITDCTHPLSDADAAEADRRRRTGPDAWQAARPVHPDGDDARRRRRAAAPRARREGRAGGAVRGEVG